MLGGAALFRFLVLWSASPVLPHLRLLGRLGMLEAVSGRESTSAGGLTRSDHAPARGGEVRVSPTLRESCGVFGVYAPNEDVARITFYGLYALQHRGQESAGIASANERRLYLRTGMGLVSQVFDEEDLSYLPGHMAIGHTRYSTTGSSLAANAQPIIIDGPLGQFALGHNGNIVNADVLRADLEEQGTDFSTGTDSEVIA